MSDFGMTGFKIAGLIAVVAAVAGACADEGSLSPEKNGGQNGVIDINNQAPDFSENNATNGDFEPEVELEFEFAEPAVVGSNVFVANETSNTVAVIDSTSLAIRTIPVGFGPTRVVGPEVAEETSQVFVLNEGASTVSVVDPETLDTKSAPVLRRANSLIANPNGEFALAWFDEERLAPGEQPGDLSAVTLVTAEGVSYQIAVGFKVERITFTQTGNTALVLTDDGVSIIRMTAVSGDEVAAPIAVLTPELQSLSRADREVLITPDGLHTIARAGNNPVVVLTRLANGEQFQALLPGTPTDLDWVLQEQLQLLALVPSEDIAVLAQVPEGIEALAAVAPVPPVLPDAGGDAGADAGPDAGSDAGDAGDTGLDAGDGGVDAGADAGPTVEPGTTWSPAEGVTYLALAQERLGAAEVDTDGAIGLLFSTLEGRRGGVLLDLETLEQRSLAFEKGVRGAVPDPRGEAFVVLHTREEGGVPPTATPADPEYIARSWGISIVDVASAVTRLVLTEQEPGDVALWNDGMLARLYMIFQRPQPGTPELPSHRDVLRVDLDSFAIESFRVPSLPDGVGIVSEARRVYVNQVHPQGRITFVDVDDDSRQTVTGYQLNAGID